MALDCLAYATSFALRPSAWHRRLQGSSVEFRAVPGTVCRPAGLNKAKWTRRAQELEQIPPPSGNQYLGVRTKEAYANPFLVVHPQTVTLTIIFRDQDSDGFSAGGILRPANARRQESTAAGRFARGTRRSFARRWPTAVWLRSNSPLPPPKASGSPFAVM